jgi:uncharacterized protein YbjT (DUF2867 family)
MTSPKIIAVVGATGAQGGGLVRAILDAEDGEYAVRALTRKPESDAAHALAELGAEVVRADLNDLDSLRQAFRGAYGAFCVTNYWELFSPEKEKEQARNLAQAAHDEGLKHVVWSTLEDTRQWVPLTDDSMPTLMERYKVPHFEGKAEADAYFTELGVPTTFMMASYYWENMIFFGGGPQKGPDGSLALVIPMGDKPLAGIAAEDIGRCVYGIFRRGDYYIGRRVGLAGDRLTLHEMADGLTRALGVEIGYNDVPADVFRSFDFPGAEDVGNMFQFYRDYSDDVLEARSIDESKSLNPALQSFNEWLAVNKDRIPLP